MTASAESTPLAGMPALDACWQRIGVQGDRSCERLVQHVHCHNCERHAEAAVLLLDRHVLDLSATDSPQATVGRDDVQVRGSTLSALIFRMGQDWLALPTSLLLEVSGLLPVHGLPYPRSRALRGLCNMRGALAPCLALDVLLGLKPETTPQDRPRMLILDAPGGALVVQVHSVEGVYVLPHAALQETRQAGGLAASQLAAAVLHWENRSVTLLDADRLTKAMLRTLA